MASEKKGAAPGVVGRQWKCDNCGAWVDDDGSGNNIEGYTCGYCMSCMYPMELKRLRAEGDPEARMTWRRNPGVVGRTADEIWAAYGAAIGAAREARNKALDALKALAEEGGADE